MVRRPERFGDSREAPALQLPRARKDRWHDAHDRIAKPRLKWIQQRILAEILVSHSASPAHRIRQGKVGEDFRHSARGPAASYCARTCATSSLPSAAHAYRPSSAARLSRDLWPTCWAESRTECDSARRLRRPPLSPSHLPQGAPTSPALANMCLYRADCRLAGLAESAGAQYTRYADDLAFSGEGDFDRRVDRFSLHAAAILHEEGFAVHHRKTRIMRQGVRQHLAGVVTNRRLNVPRADYDLLKAILTNCARHGAPDRIATGSMTSVRTWKDGSAISNRCTLRRAASCASSSGASCGSDSGAGIPASAGFPAGWTRRNAGPRPERPPHNNRVSVLGGYRRQAATEKARNRLLARGSVWCRPA